MKKLLVSLLFPVVCFGGTITPGGGTIAGGNLNAAQLTGTEPLAVVNPAVVTNVFKLPFTLYPQNTSVLIYPTNFLVANTATQGQVIIMHINGTTIVHNPVAISSPSFGTNWGLAMNDAGRQWGDVFFVGPGTYDMSNAWNVMLPPAVAAGPISLDDGQGDPGVGCSLVGAGRSTVFNCTNDTGAAADIVLGSYSSVRDIIITNLNNAAFLDNGQGSATFAANQFDYFVNTEFDSAYQDMWILSNTKPNTWIQNCIFRYPYDVFANSIMPAVNSVIVSYGNTYIGNGVGLNDYARTQLGVMARTAFSANDIITNMGGRFANIGLSAGESSKTNSVLFAWNDNIGVSGTNQISVSGGIWGSNQVFLGPGMVYDVTKAFPQSLTNNWAGSFKGNGSGLTNGFANITAYTNFLFAPNTYTNTTTRSALVSVNGVSSPTTTLSGRFAIVTSPTGATFTTNAAVGLDSDTVFTTVPHGWFQTTAIVPPGGVWKVVDITAGGVVMITNSYWQTLQ